MARTDAGTVATPFGWRVAVGALDPPSFDVSRANTELGVRVFVVKADDAVELYDAVRQKIGSTVGHPELHLNSQREGWLYDEAVYGSQRVFAACVMAHAGRRDLAVVAIVRGGRDMQVSRAAYEGVGGRDFLCRIMESVHLRSVP